MPEVMNMPKIGVNMTEGVIVEWLVKEGESVTEGDVIFTAETDKSVQEISATVTGVLVQRLKKEGERAACQEPVAVFAAPGEKIEELPQQGKPTLTGATSTGVQSRPAATTRVPAALQGRVRISPLARKVASSLGIDYRAVPPAEPGYRITRADVLAYAERAGTASTVSGAVMQDTTAVQSAVARQRAAGFSSVYPHADLQVTETVQLSGIRKIVSERMSLSASTTARASLSLTVDARGLKRWREMLSNSGQRVSYNSLIVAAVARALDGHPVMNSRLEGSTIQVIGNKNVELAVQTDKGLTVIVIPDADTKGVLSIEREILAKVERARKGGSRAEDVEGGTFTVTNLGMYDVEVFTPIINPPECGIIGIGKIVEKPFVDEDRNFGVRPEVQVSLAFDHRIVDGAPAARFLSHVKELLEEPLKLMS